ncbi:MAG: Ig-like domain-containing protein [Ruminococcus sp.]|nr:Ig-like domain-containing protein [Ruminococcus sp.]
MSKIIRQTTTYILIAVLVFSVFAGLTVSSEQTVSAASYPTGYPNTYKNTGIGATDIIGVARTQIGYQENSGGTKYGYWYNSYFVNQPWCAMFVSWCANQAKIPQSVISKFAACSVGISWFKSQKRWYDSKYFGGTYTPQKGDIVFYSDSGIQSDPSHVGIVAGLNGNYLDVIEGNATNSSVCEYTTSSSRSLSSSYVIGYGHPNYSVDAVNEPNTYEVWQVSVGTLNMRKSASTSASLVSKVPFGGEINVTKVKAKTDYVWGYASYGSKKGWVALDYCDYIYGNINGVYYQLRPSLTPEKKTVYVDYTATLTSTNSLGGKYTSSDETKAKVSSKGKISALKAGKTTVTLTTATGTATCIVTVKNPTISNSTATACIGDSYTLSVNHTKLTPTWSSSDKTIAKVSSKGKVTALKEGEVTITAKVGDVSLKCAFVVTKYPTTYENFKTSKDTYLKNSCTELKSLSKIPKGTALKVKSVYYSSTWSLGEITYNGKTGWVILNKCKYLNGSINGKVYLVRPYLAEAATTMYLQNVYYIKVKDAGDTTTFTADGKIARVTAAGKLRGIKAGSTTINVKSGSTKLKFKLTVMNPKLSAKKATFMKGGKKKLTVTGGKGKITWTSSDNKVAEVSSSGEIVAKGYGTAIITAVRNKVPMTCKVTVYDPILDSTYKVVRVKQTKALKVLQSSGAAVTWKSENTKIAKVNSKGEVTGVAVGRTKVTATVDGVTLKCDIRIAKAAS